MQDEHCFHEFDGIDGAVCATGIVFNHLQDAGATKALEHRCSFMLVAMLREIQGASQGRGCGRPAPEGHQKKEKAERQGAIRPSRAQGGPPEEAIPRGPMAAAVSLVLAACRVHTTETGS